MVTMLEKAINYVQCLELQIGYETGCQMSLLVIVCVLNATGSVAFVHSFKFKKNQER